ncbi:hypothetical protein BN14_12031 [Rhizoctonia solani AG-1 IB]|uniref:Tc1-like transposase DDE domain-containing protein n=1 Tax=Thanatephorus cucumeris (strain AG1-IB / isolate 7/3/14) TaxID=1108050 RepID=M5CEJ6_THACB|nr:hypothetical protein BN14_12031 [Rhizoctonia solani AG-1 IB]
MPRKKNIVVRRSQNLLSGRGAQPAPQELESDTGSNNPGAGSQPLSASESQPIASSSKLTLDDDIHVQLDYTHERSNSPAEGLASLTRKVTLEDDIELEDPPEIIEDPSDQRNPSSLAEEEEEEEEEDLPAPGGEEPQTDEDSKKNNRTRISKESARTMVCELNQIIQSSFHGHGRRRICTLGDVVLTRLRLMAGTLNLMVETTMNMMDASVTAAVVFRRGKWAARQVRAWIRTFQKDNKLPTNVYGTWNGSVIEDEDLSAAIRHWLRGRGKYIHARDVVDFFGSPEAERFSSLIDGPPSLSTAQRWMYRMGYTWTKEKHGQFADGHERDDVRNYRMNFYVPEWAKLELRMRRWDSEGNEILPKLAEGERVVVVWFHDESTFYAHDRRLTRWVHESETPGINKKGEGVSLMVADFVSADYGWLRSTTDPPNTTPMAGTANERENLNNARVIFRAGKQRDGWFGTADVVKQLSRAMTLVKKQFPNEDHVFIFDNATIHTKLPETVPNVSKLTLGPSQKVKGEEFGPSGEKIPVNYAPAVLPDGTIQQLYHPLDHPIEKLQGAFKGMALILEERGVPNARKLKLVCGTVDSRKHACPPDSTNCCARRTMMNQPDILAQKSILRLQAEAEGFSIIYLPKYHCELNPIEQCWGAAKRIYRDLPPSSSEADLKQNMLSALDSVKLESIRRFAARSQRFVHAYAHGLSGVQAAWAAKQFRGHRIIPDALLEAMDHLD